MGTLWPVFYFDGLTKVLEYPLSEMFYNRFRNCSRFFEGSELQRDIMLRGSPALGKRICWLNSAVLGLRDLRLLSLFDKLLSLKPEKQKKPVKANNRLIKRLATIVPSTTMFPISSLHQNATVHTHVADLWYSSAIW